MPAEERPPEQVIRQWLDANGPATVSLATIAETWRLDSVGAADRRRIGTALEAAGVLVEPPLARAGEGDKLRLRVVEPAASDLTPPAGVNSPEPARPPLAARLAPVAIALMVLGALGPWSKAVFVTDYGTDRAGWAVLAVAAVATGLLIVHARRGRRSIMPLLVAVLATFAVTLVASELRELSEDEFIGPAWGAYAAFVGSAGLVISSVALLARRA